jgi:hypothetical protein
MNTLHRLLCLHIHERKEGIPTESLLSSKNLLANEHPSVPSFLLVGFRVIVPSRHSLLSSGEPKSLTEKPIDKVIHSFFCHNVHGFTPSPEQPIPDGDSTFRRGGGPYHLARLRFDHLNAYRDDISAGCPRPHFSIFLDHAG